MTGDEIDKKCEEISHLLQEACNLAKETGLYDLEELKDALEAEWTYEETKK